MAETKQTTQTPTPASPNQNWQIRNYALGLIVGLVVGLMAAHAYNRSAAEDLREGEKPEVPTMQLLAVAVAVLGIIRQIAAMGKNNKRE